MAFTLSLITTVSFPVYQEHKIITNLLKPRAKKELKVVIKAKGIITIDFYLQTDFVHACNDGLPDKAIADGDYQTHMVTPNKAVRLSTRRKNGAVIIALNYTSELL